MKSKKIKHYVQKKKRMPSYIAVESSVRTCPHCKNTLTIILGSYYAKDILIFKGDITSKFLGCKKRK